MGVDTKIMLPGNVRLKDVTKVLGAAVGCPKRKQPFQHNDGWYAEVDVVNAVQTSIPEMVHIEVNDFLMVDGEKNHYVSYHFEPDSGTGRLLFPRSTAFWIAVGRRLVDFFGGWIDYDDCDDVSVNYRKKAKSDRENRPSGNKPWYDFQQRILDIKPITEREWRRMDKYASYKIK